MRYLNPENLGTSIAPHFLLFFSTEHEAGGFLVQPASRASLQILRPDAGGLEPRGSYLPRILPPIGTLPHRHA